MDFEELCKNVTTINGHNRYFASLFLKIQTGVSRMKKYYSQRNNEIHPELSANVTSFMNSIANKTIEDWNELKIKIRDYDMTKKLKPKQKKCPKCNIPYKITFKGQYVVKYICHKCGYEKIYEGDINDT